MMKVFYRNPFHRLRHQREVARARGCLLLPLLVCFFTAFSAQGMVYADNGVGVFEKVIQKDQLSLWVDKTTGLCKVVDQRNNMTWDSLPALSNQINDDWVKMFHSAFIIRYLNEYGTADTALTGDANCLKRFSVSKAGISFEFSFTRIKISFTVQYSISENSLRVNIPYRFIADPEKHLLDIRFLPYFGYLPFQSAGYLVLPDGCGGIITPNYLTRTYTTARVYGNRFSWSVGSSYGETQRLLKLNDYSDPQNALFNMPIFGIVKENSRGSGSVLGVVTQGQFQAELGTEITPFDNLATVSPRLIFREIASDMFGRTKAGPVFDPHDRTVYYYFMASNKEASYVGIAGKYRQLLIASRKQTVDGAGFLDRTLTGYRIRLFFGVERQYKDTRELLCLTTFKQAESILNDLYHKGVRDLQVVLTGWSRKGYLGNNPLQFPPDQRFGGMAGLKRLVAAGKKLGYSIGLQFDNFYTLKSSSGFVRAETVKDIQGVPVDIALGGKEYLLCQGPAWRKFFKNEYPIIKDLKPDGALIFEGFNSGFFECYDSLHPFGAKDIALAFRKSVKTLAGSNPVGTIGVTDFLTPQVSCFYDLPVSCSEMCDQAIPLTPLVFHGLAGYSFEPLNLRLDRKKEFLKMVEYGGIPNAYLTSSTVEELVHAKHNPIFSGRFTDWRREIVAEYQLYENDLRQLQDIPIIDHQRLARDVYLTIYENGKKAVVNYSATRFKFEGVMVEPLAYRIFED